LARRHAVKVLYVQPVISSAAVLFGAARNLALAFTGESSPVTLATEPDRPDALHEKVFCLPIIRAGFLAAPKSTAALEMTGWTFASLNSIG
jgi:hypothetical protein